MLTQVKHVIMVYVDLQSDSIKLQNILSALQRDYPFRTGSVLGRPIWTVASILRSLNGQPPTEGNPLGRQSCLNIEFQSLFSYREFIPSFGTLTAHSSIN